VTDRPFLAVAEAFARLLDLPMILDLVRQPELGYRENSPLQALANQLAACFEACKLLPGWTVTDEILLAGRFPI